MSLHRAGAKHPEHSPVPGGWELPSLWDVHACYSLILHAKSSCRAPLDSSQCFNYPNFPWRNWQGRLESPLLGPRTPRFGPTRGFLSYAKKSPKTVYTQWGSGVDLQQQKT